MSKATRRLAWCALGALLLGGCELIVDFDRSKIDGGTLDATFQDAPSDVNQPDVTDATTSDVADTGADVGSDASDAGDAGDASIADADAGTSSDASDASDAVADASAASLSITPTSHDFLTVSQGTSSSAFTFTIKNDGGTTSGSITVSISGTNSGDFATSNDTCTGNTLAASATCTVDVTFTPQTTSGESGSLDVTATPGGSPSATLSGTGQ